MFSRGFSVVNRRYKTDFRRQKAVSFECLRLEMVYCVAGRKSETEFADVFFLRDACIATVTRSTFDAMFINFKKVGFQVLF